MRIPGHPVSDSDNIRSLIPEYPVTCDVPPLSVGL